MAAGGIGRVNSDVEIGIAITHYASSTAVCHGGSRIQVNDTVDAELAEFQADMKARFVRIGGLIEAVGLPSRPCKTSATRMNASFLG